VIADSAIAALLVAGVRAPSNAVPPANVISAAWPDDSIIGIANAPIVAAGPCVATPRPVQRLRPLRSPRCPPMKKT
jgi:hypothetical protein